MEVRQYGFYVIYELGLLMLKVLNLKLPAELLNHAKGLAGWRGKTLRQFVIEAIEEKVERATHKTHAEVEERLRSKKNSQES